jgi:hypothetical protein
MVKTRRIMIQRVKMYDGKTRWTPIVTEHGQVIVSMVSVFRTRAIARNVAMAICQVNDKSSR